MHSPSYNLHDYIVLPYTRLCYKFITSTFHQGPRRLLDYLILFLEKGHYILEVEGMKYDLREGDIAIIQPGVLFSTRGFGDCIVPNTHLDFFYNPHRERSFVTLPGQIDLSDYSKLIQPRLNDFPHIDIPVKFVPDAPEKFRNTLLQMIESSKGIDYRNTIRVQQLAMDLLLQILGDHSESYSTDFTEQKFKIKMNAYLSYNLSSSLSVKSMANHAGYSESHFSALFTKAFGVAPHHYLLDLRLQRARELLATTDLYLVLIAEYCGFANAAHFSKVFKMKNNFSPKAFRLKSQKTDFKG